MGETLYDELESGPIEDQVTHKSGDTSMSLGSWSFLGSSHSFPHSLRFVSFH